MGSCQIQHLQVMKGMNLSLSEENRLTRDSNQRVLDPSFCSFPRPSEWWWWWWWRVMTPSSTASGDADCSQSVMSSQQCGLLMKGALTPLSGWSNEYFSFKDTYQVFSVSPHFFSAYFQVSIRVQGNRTSIMSATMPSPIKVVFGKPSSSRIPRLPAEANQCRCHDLGQSGNRASPFPRSLDRIRPPPYLSISWPL
jgi:hypothetical protein